MLLMLKSHPWNKYSSVAKLLQILQVSTQIDSQSQVKTCNNVCIRYPGHQLDLHTLLPPSARDAETCSRADLRAHQSGSVWICSAYREWNRQER